jgi:hypothetical protein
MTRRGLFRIRSYPNEGGCSSVTIATPPSDKLPRPPKPLLVPETRMLSSHLLRRRAVLSPLRRSFASSNALSSSKPCTDPILFPHPLPSIVRLTEPGFQADPPALPSVSLPLTRHPHLSSSPSTLEDPPPHLCQPSISPHPHLLPHADRNLAVPYRLA